MKEKEYHCPSCRASGTPALLQKEATKRTYLCFRCGTTWKRGDHNEFVKVG